jgi:hypothetical protein
MLPGDLLLIMGRDWVSREIARVTNSCVSHVAIVLSARPRLVIEALAGGVTTRSLAACLSDAEAAWVASRRDLSDDQRDGIAYAACLYSGVPYDYTDIVLQALNAAFKTTWFTDNLHLLPELICSQLADKAYREIGLDFGLPDRAVTPGDIMRDAQTIRPTLYTLTAVSLAT